ncbi:hypothetical protein Ocin01_07529 [Orchesella cincta]|uniref:Uncharacterized protein n=1 Tax=Orchesella cincta TaxID=48709 RepID=A0A1D2N1Q6_ORCCI|nr:hypothetical protein Ocin01_07529 [Orchesella cincta]
MHKMMKVTCQFFLVFLVLQQLYHVSAIGVGCTNDQACTDLCGYAGGGKCTNGTYGSYCKCSTCPQRNVFELVNLPKVCTLDPTCVCPIPTFSLTSGKLYTGHTCLHFSSLRPICICFCMPTTVQSIPDIVKCPFVIPTGSNTTSTNTTSTNSTSSTSTTTEAVAETSTTSSSNAE